MRYMIKKVQVRVQGRNMLITDTVTMSLFQGGKKSRINMGVCITEIFTLTDMTITNTVMTLMVAMPP